MSVKVKLPVGSALEKTDLVTKRIEGIIKSMPGVEKLYVMSGGYWNRRNIYEKSNESDMQIQLQPKEKRPVATPLFIKKLQEKIKAEAITKTKVKVMRTPLRGIKQSSTSDIDIRVKGYNLDKLFSLAQEIENRISDMEGLSNLDISVDFSRPEFHVTLDRPRAADFGLSAQSVSEVLQASVDGLVATEFTDKEMNIDHDVRVLADPSALVRKESIENIALFPSTGVKLRLKEIAKVQASAGPVQIDRENQVRMVAVTADASGKNAGLLLDEIKRRISSLELPLGYTVGFSGEDESIKESNRQLLFVIALAVFLVFVVMAVQYESLADPVVIMVTLPLALVGSLALLFLTKTPFGATVFLGMILLVGIVVNNAIVLVEYMNLLRREQGMPLGEAVLAASSTRLKPILMTSLTTIAGLFPLWFGWGEGLEMLRPLAITVIGGLLTSTLLTLFVIPCVYTLFHARAAGITEEKK